MQKSPIEFAKSIGPRRHIALFYEELEYGRAIAFEFLKAGIGNKEHSFYVFAKGEKDFLDNEFKKSSYGSNWRFNHDFLVSMKLIHDFLHIENTPSLTYDDKRSYYSLVAASNLIKQIKQKAEKKEMELDYKKLSLRKTYIHIGLKGVASRHVALKLSMIPNITSILEVMGNFDIICVFFLETVLICPT